MTQTWWLSFCDSDRPTGQQSLGVVIVDVDAADVARATSTATAIRASHGLPPLTDPSTLWMCGAIAKTHRLHVNPGGEVQAMRMDDKSEGHEAVLAAAPRDRLLQLAELATLGFDPVQPDRAS